MQNRHIFPRDPNDVQVWLVGSGIASLTAAIRLIKEAKVPESNIHIIDTHTGTGGGMRMQGNEDTDSNQSVLEAVRKRDISKRSTGAPEVLKPHFYFFKASPFYSYDSSAPTRGSLAESLFPVSAMDAVTDKHHAPPARSVTLGRSGPEVSHHRGVQIGIAQRMVLVGCLLEHENAIGKKSIRDIIDSTFSSLNSGCFGRLRDSGLYPWHGAVKFQRHLRKYLGILKRQGVDFRFHQQVTDLKAYPEGGPTTISQIEVMTEAGTEELITLDPQDILIVTLGSTSSGAAMGSDSTPPDGLTSNWEEVLDSDWKLWEKLAQKSAKLGNPMNFLPRIQESTVETFTATFTGPGFNNLYEKLTQERPGTDALLSLSESNWGVTITVPHQPVFSRQSDDVPVMLGYALNPVAGGNYVKKEMWRCTGQEILKEILSHLGYRSEDSAEAAAILAAAKTVPYGLPLGTAPLLTRSAGDRPPVIPKWTTNIARIG
ncbi:streptococcal 67 kDa myosin-cross-reactive antigen like family-domain-containing protein [Aspergillus granulosus]|uniref:Streptococcal 67 kDa myosin-cross-reactive antigen like family-domain-containing protein n=1 Tax=Aspergillus granulosus TaxID=176169 RepID=A0ABR4H1Y1_9EURO